MGAGGEVHFLHRVFQIAGAFGIELAMRLHLARAHRCVGSIRGFVETFTLDPARLHDTLAEVHQRHFDMQVDPIQQRPRDALAVVLDLPRGTAALTLGVAIEPAGVRFPFWEIANMKAQVTDLLCLSISLEGPHSRQVPKTRTKKPGVGMFSRRQANLTQRNPKE